MYYYSNNLLYFRHQLLKLFGNKVITEAFGKFMQVNAESSLKIYCSAKQNFGEFVLLDSRVFVEEKPGEVESK